MIKLVPERSVLKLDVGDRIRLGAAQFERLCRASFADLQSRIL